jgi:hypothetical protein
MTRDDVIRIAREAGFNLEQGFLLRVTGIDEDLERFANLVAAHERERCAKLLESTDLGALKNDPITQLWLAGILNSFAKAIRDRA